MHYHMLCGRIGGRCRNDLTIYFITIFSNYYESNCGKQVLPLRFTKCFFLRNQKLSNYGSGIFQLSSLPRSYIFVSASITFKAQQVID